MQSINALSLTPAVKGWLINSRRPRILHVFNQACNLINEHRDVLSIVTPQIGNGPFNLVVEENVIFAEHLNLQSSVSVSPQHLALGNLTIHTSNATIWNPCPNWAALHTKRNNILSRLTQVQIAHHQLPLLQHSHLLVFSLSFALANLDIPAAKETISKLAGLGQGLTPAGDDFIMGALYAVWIIHPFEKAAIFAKEVAETAAPLTTSLSAAWLRSTGRGEAGILWHDFFDSLILPTASLESPVAKILSVGETSGADALAGFISVLTAFKERIIGECPS